MPESLVLEVLRQGGFAVLCGVVVVLWRRDAQRWEQKAEDKAAAYMAFGERTAGALTQASETMRQMGGILERIEGHLARTYVCPVATGRPDLIREVVEEAEGSRQRGRR